MELSTISEAVMWTIYTYNGLRGSGVSLLRRQPEIKFAALMRMPQRTITRHGLVNALPFFLLYPRFSLQIDNEVPATLR